MTQVRVQDGKAVCPQCGSECLVYACDVTHYAYLAVSQSGEVYGRPHQHESEPYDPRVICNDCAWYEDHTDIKTGD